jgi:DNA-binding NtrC family response regulator
MRAQIQASFPTASPANVPSTGRDLPTREGKRVVSALVVDDEPLVRWAIAETLHAAGYEIQEAADADSAVHTLFARASPPDLVLLDLRLPDCADLSLLETVCRLAPAATIILMTAFATPEIRDRAFRLGAAYVLDKPFDVDGLDSLITTLRTRQ